jgi:hypothetical protein
MNCVKARFFGRRDSMLEGLSSALLNPGAVDLSIFPVFEGGLRTLLRGFF